MNLDEPEFLTLADCIGHRLFYSAMIEIAQKRLDKNGLAAVLKQRVNQHK